MSVAREFAKLLFTHLFTNFSFSSSISSRAAIQFLVSRNALRWFNSINSRTNKPIMFTIRYVNALAVNYKSKKCVTNESFLSPIQNRNQSQRTDDMWVNVGLLWLSWPTCCEQKMSCIQTTVWSSSYRLLNDRRDVIDFHRATFCRIWRFSSIRKFYYYTSWQKFLYEKNLLPTHI